MVIWFNGAVGNAGVEDGILPAGQVASLGDVDALRRAMIEQREAIVQSAHDEAQALLTEARQQAEQLIESAHVEARRAKRQGYEDGLRNAVLEWHEQQAGKSIDMAEALRRMHEKLAAIVTSAVERIVHTEERGALYQRALRSVQGLTRGASTLALRVNAADFEYARAALGSLQSLGSNGLSVDVSVDPALKPGSCIFESEVGILDASLQTQLDGLRAAMDRAVRKAVTDSDTPADGYEASPSDTYHALAASAIDIADGEPGTAASDEQGFDEGQHDDLNDTRYPEAAHE